VDSFSGIERKRKERKKGRKKEKKEEEGRWEEGMAGIRRGTR
jgi:hypothetical protein